VKLHRSLIFWAGLVVMGFITWAWRDSARFNSNAGNHRIYVENTNSVTFFSLNYTNWNLGGWKVWSGWDGYRTAALERRPMRIRGISFGSRKEQVWAQVSHSSLVLAAVMVWTSCLAWRWRRMRKRG
jgi:hypothetical protein